MIHGLRWEPRDEQLRLITLNARHGGWPLLLHEITKLGLTMDEVRAAEAIGKDERALGLRCFCIQCEYGAKRLEDRESQRRDYRERRRVELMASGIDRIEADRIVEQEVDGGAALQAQAVVITRGAA